MAPDATIPEVAAADARALIDAGAMLLDVRELKEWQAGHAPEAVFMPLGEVTARTAELTRDVRIVAICRSGARSGRVTAFLRSEGFDVVNLAGGMRAWFAAGLPVVTDDGAAGAVI